MSHTILTDAMSGSAVYVGMTRGKEENRLHIIAESLPDARAQLIEAMALAGVPLAGILRVTEHGQRIDFRSDTVPVMGVVQPAIYKEEFGTW